jgi:hypothetical protein
VLPVWAEIEDDATAISGITLEGYNPFPSQPNIQGLADSSPLSFFDVASSFRLPGQKINPRQTVLDPFLEEAVARVRIRLHPRNCERSSKQSISRSDARKP